MQLHRLKAGRDGGNKISDLQTLRGFCVLSWDQSNACKIHAVTVGYRWCNRAFLPLKLLSATHSTSVNIALSD